MNKQHNSYLNIPEERFDSSFINPTNGFGGETSTIQQTTFGSRLILGRHIIESLYQSEGLAANAIDIPATEIWRAGVDFFMVDGSDSDLPAQIDKELTRLNWITWNIKAEKDAWKTGGSALISLMDDGREYREPLGKTKGIRLIQETDRWGLIPQDWERELLGENAENFGQPTRYKASITYPGVAFTEEIHPDRVIRFKAPFTGQFNETQYNMGWGEPRFTRIFNHIRKLLVGLDTSAEAFERFFQFSFKSPGYKKWAAAKDDSTLGAMRNRISALWHSWGSTKLAVTEGGEEFEVKNIPVAGLSELILLHPKFFAGAAQVPLPRLLSGEGGTLNGSTMEGDEVNFINNVDGWQGEKSGVVLDWLRLLSTYMGFDPESIGFKFRPLFQPTEKEQAETRKIVSETDERYVNIGVMSAMEIRESRAIERGMADFTSYTGDAAGRKELEDLKEMDRQQMEDNTPTAEPKGKDGMQEE